MTREEAIEVVKERLDYYEREKRLKAACEVLIPELAESEDERIRKEIIEFVDTTTLSSDERHHRWIAYLEKQKEQKPAECIEDSVKFENGFKAGRESGLRDGQKYVLNNLDSYGFCKAAEWSAEEEKMLQSIIQDFKAGKVSTIGQEQWLKSLRPQPKQEWSEENELTIAELINYFEGDPLECSIEEMEQRIKSLRPSWKPCEQEKGALKTAIWVLTEERSFPNAAANLQSILDAFDGKEARKEWKPSEEQPSLPDNLDEVAREIVIEMHPCLKDCAILGDRLTRGQLMALVKAGAEWMAGQGYTVDGAVICDKELTRGYKDIAMSIPDELKVDDKVTIQIRKRQ